jgi:hypothetical protein
MGKKKLNLKIFSQGNLLLGLLVLFYLKDLGAVIGAGVYAPFPGSIQTDKKGGKNYFTPMPMIQLEHNFVFRRSFVIRPQLGFIYHLPVPSSTPTKSDYSKYGLHAQILFKKDFTKRLQFLYGVGNHMTVISGSGGTRLLNNGNSETTFSLPSESVTSYNGTLDLGFLFWLKNNTVSLQWMTSIFSILNAEKRDFSTSFVINWEGKKR